MGSFSILFNCLANCLDLSMSYNPENALIIQSDRTILLEVHAPAAEEAREAISPFAELVKSPEHIQLNLRLDSQW